MNDAEMRLALQRVAGYREVCQIVRSGAGHTLFNAALWIGLTVLLHQNGGAQPIVLVYFVLGLAELLIGLGKKFRPSLEAVLGDAVVLLCFGAFILGRQAWNIQAGLNVQPISVLFGFWWLHDAYKSLKAYNVLRSAFPDRPTREQILWFNDLVREIRAADPEVDDAALELPARPAWKAKLLGGTAFFVALKGETVLVAGPEDFLLVREEEDHGLGRRKAELWVHGEPLGGFEMADASWKNYQAWLAGRAGNAGRV